LDCFAGLRRFLRFEAASNAAVMKKPTCRQLHVGFLVFLPSCLIADDSRGCHDESGGKTQQRPFFACPGGQ
jgi:hypothetical protein